MGVKRTILAAVAASMLAVPASAAVVSQSGIVDANGDRLAFNFDNLAPADPTEGATITISSGIATNGSAADAGIDLDGEGHKGFAEFFNVYVDGGNFGRFTCGGGSGIRLKNQSSNGAADCIFTLRINLNPGQLGEALADGLLNLVVRFGAGVGHHNDGDQLNVSLAYTPAQVVAAPLPASAGMLLGALGLAGIAARRRKSKS